MEVAAGAAYTGARALVTMKQVGLNVASDPLMSLEYIGVKGGMVVLVADDPGPISSQTEQDTRTFGMFSKVPVFDPSSVAEAYEMIQEAFAFSEEYKTPVFFRATTRVDHGYEAVDVKDVDEYYVNPVEGFIKDASRWVIFPRLSVKNHALIEKRNADLKDVFSDYHRNQIVEEPGTDAPCRKGIATQGVNFMYTLDSLRGRNARVMRVATPFPFPEKLALSFLEGLDEVLCVEELDPVIERALTYICGKYGLSVKIRGMQCGRCASQASGTARQAARIMCGMSPQGLLLRGQDRNAGPKDYLLRRYRLLYTWKCNASGYVRYLSLHGRGHRHRAGCRTYGTGYEVLRLCR